MRFLSFLFCSKNQKVERKHLDFCFWCLQHIFVTITQPQVGLVFVFLNWALAHEIPSKTHQAHFPHVYTFAGPTCRTSKTSPTTFTMRTTAARSSLPSRATAWTRPRPKASSQSAPQSHDSCFISMFWNGSCAGYLTCAMVCRSPLAQMEEERREHVMKMKKMEAEMEQVFEMKVKEKKQKLKDSEAEVSLRLASQLSIIRLHCNSTDFTLVLTFR